MNKRIAVQPLLAVAAVLALSTSVVRADPDITVDVNNQAIAFSGSPPIEVNNSVLVPLRGVFEALGASVNYDGPTKTITAQNGSATVILQLGSSIASVNSQTQMLSQPAQVVNGTTLVPLRFVAQALGATVNWDGATSTVQIYSQQSQAETPPQPTQTTPNEVFGRVVRVDTDTPPGQITIHSHDQDATVPLSDSTILLRSREGEPGVQVSLDRIRPGDEIKAELDNSGVAQTVVAIYDEVSGIVQSTGVLANGDGAVTLQSGSTVEIVPDASLRMQDHPIGFGDIRPGEEVVIRTNPHDTLGYGLDVESLPNPGPRPPDHGPGPDHGPRPDQGPVQQQQPVQQQPVRQQPARQQQPVQQTKIIQSFSANFDPRTPLLNGSSAAFTLRATPGGQATLSIGSLASNVRMRETSPGVYSGSYTVHTNRNENNVPVSATFVDINGNTVIANLSSGVNFAPSPAAVPVNPPPANGGNFVSPLTNTSAAGTQEPLILSPANGSKVTSPLSISGTADPNALVSLSITSSDQTAAGTLDQSQPVVRRQAKADARGNWKIDHIALPVPAFGRNVVTTLTLTITSQSAGGPSSAPVSSVVHL